MRKGTFSTYRAYAYNANIGPWNTASATTMPRMGASNVIGRMLSTMINSTHELQVERATRTITLKPVTGHSATMFMLHGLGDTAAGWADAAAHFSASLPHVKFVLPTAPTQPVTLNGGAAMPSWYDIRGTGSRVFMRTATDSRVLMRTAHG
jgi:hypothetical protein